MRKRLNENVLVPGDIALTTTDSLQSWKVRVGTSSDVSHAMLYVTHCSIIHAVGTGVQAENTQRILFEDDTPIHVMRLKSGLPPEVAQQICDYVRTIVGSEYSLREAIASALGALNSVSAKQFCSRLVAQAYNKHGYQLTANPDYCTPGDLFRSDQLLEIAGATIPVSDEEVAFWESEKESGPEKISAATDFILKGARKFDTRVQNMNDVGRLVIEGPQHDNDIDELYRASGYLDMWKIEYEEHPWRYDLAQMETQPGQASVRKYCESIAKTEPRDNNRFTKSLAAYELHNSKWSRKTFASLIGLYRELVKQHAIGVDTATQWLERHG